MFSSYVGLDPVSTIYPKKLSGISSTPKIFEILPPPPPPQYSHSIHLPKWKILKYVEMTPKTSPNLWWPPKISTKSSYPKIYSCSWNPPQKYWNSKFEPPKMVRASGYVHVRTCMKISEYPLVLAGEFGSILTIHGRYSWDWKNVQSPK